MSLEYKFQPLNGEYPRALTANYSRSASPFGKTWTEVQNILEKELRFLSYRSGSVILQTAHSAYDVRKDGQLRSDVRRPEHPGVVLKFEVYNSKAKRYERMSFECDQFADWKSNVRAIADAMESLRKVDRYGVTGGGKTASQYEGYKALPEAKDEGDLGQALGIMSLYSAYSTWQIKENADIYRTAYRQAIHNTHPDKNPDDHRANDKFHAVQTAKTVLDKYFQEK